MGVFYSFWGAVIWPCYALVMDKKYLGIAFGISQSLTNIFNFIFEIIVTYLIGISSDTRYGYFWPEIFYCGLGLISVILTIFIIIENKKMGNPLGKVAK